MVYEEKDKMYQYGLNKIKIFLEMKHKGWLSIEKIILKLAKIKILHTENLIFTQDSYYFAKTALSFLSNFKKIVFQASIRNSLFFQ